MARAFKCDRCGDFTTDSRHQLRVYEDGSWQRNDLCENCGDLADRFLDESLL